MTSTPALHGRSGALGPGRFLLRRVPFWAIVVSSVGFLFALSPNLLHVYGIHNDYENLVLKNRGLLFAEAEQLFSIARPISAIFSNITLLPADSIADFRWTRLFSAFTVCFLGFQIISISVHRLRVDTLSAVAIALVTFLVPAFIYSELNAPAWAAHLLPVLIALLAYEVLSQSNVQAISFAGIVLRREYGSLWRQLLAYCRLRSVWGACIILQLAFYDFPPNALVVAIFPVVAVFFSRAPGPYRLLVAWRDIGFVVVNLVLYVMSSTLLYIPFVRLLTFRNSEAWRHSHLSKFDERVANSYNYKFNTDPGEMLARLRGIAKVSGDLWFMPQARLHLVFAAAVSLALVIIAGRWFLANRGRRSGGLRGAATIAVPVVCFLMSTTAVLGSGGGFVSYRTIPISMVIAAIVFLYSICSLAQGVGNLLSRSRTVGANLANGALVLTAGVAVAGNFQMNYLTMKLARNETAYFNGIIRQAIDNRSTAVVIVDPRPFSLPEDHPVAYDQRGNAIPPYELSCFSGVCLQNGAIVTILAEQMGVPRGRLKVYSLRGGERVPDATCQLLTGPTSAIPPGLSEEAANTISFLRRLAPITCVSYSMAWRDLDLDSTP